MSCADCGIPTWMDCICVGPGAARRDAEQQYDEEHAVPAPSAKVRRLLADKRVLPAGAATAYDVRGDHGQYRVLLGDRWTHCDCPAQRERCSHVEAALLLDAALRRDECAGVAA